MQIEMNDHIKEEDEIAEASIFSTELDGLDTYNMMVGHEGIHNSMDDIIKNDDLVVEKETEAGIYNINNLEDFNKNLNPLNQQDNIYDMESKQNEQAEEIEGKKRMLDFLDRHYRQSITQKPQQEIMNDPDQMFINQLPQSQQLPVSTFSNMGTSKTETQYSNNMTLMSENPMAEIDFYYSKEQVDEFSKYSMMTVILNQHATIVYVSDSFYYSTGFSSDEILNKNWFDVCIPSNERERIYGWFYKLISGIHINIEEVKFATNHILTKNGDKLQVVFYNNVFKTQDGIFVNTVGLFLPKNLSNLNNAPVVIKCDGHTTLYSRAISKLVLDTSTVIASAGSNCPTFCPIGNESLSPRPTYGHNDIQDNFLMSPQTNELLSTPLVDNSLELLDGNLESSDDVKSSENRKAFVTLSTYKLFRFRRFKMYIIMGKRWREKNDIDPDEIISSGLNAILVREGTNEVISECSICSPGRKAVEIGITSKKGCITEGAQEKYCFDNCRTNCSSSRYHLKSRLQFIINNLPGGSFRTASFVLQARDKGKGKGKGKGVYAETQKKQLVNMTPRSLSEKVLFVESRCMVRTYMIFAKEEEVELYVDACHNYIKQLPGYLKYHSNINNGLLVTFSFFDSIKTCTESMKVSQEFINNSSGFENPLDCNLYSTGYVHLLNVCTSW